MLINILSQSSFWMVNKKIASEVGIEAALLLSDLVSKNEYFKTTEALINIDGEYYFYATSESIKSDTQIGYKVQKRCIEKLKEKGFIKTSLTGVPATLHFTICELRILEFLTSQFYPNGNSSFTQTAKLDLPKRQNYIYKNKEIIIKNNLMSVCTDQSEDLGLDCNQTKKTSSQKEKLDFDKFMVFWNKNCKRIVKVKFFTEKRRKALCKLNDKYGKESIFKACDVAFKSHFLNNLDGDGWRMDLDFFLIESNFVKILENKYDGIKKNNSSVL